MNIDDESSLHQEQIFSCINYSDTQLNQIEFVKCEFDNCDFSNSDLSHSDFVDCTFKNCNFSLTTITGTGFKDVTFNSCKILGVDFSRCSKFMFSFKFESSHLDYSTFFGRKLKKTRFVACSLKETDFEEADLTSCVFQNCDLSGATFVRSILEKTDFSSARNFSIDPGSNKIKQTKFAASGLAGLLDQYDLHIDYNS